MAYEIIRSLPRYDILAPPMPGTEVRDMRAGYRGKRFQFFVYDPKTRKRVSNRFHNLKDGEVWAKDNFALLRTDQRRAGRALLVDFIPSYLKVLELRKRNSTYRSRVKRVLEAAAAAGVKDVKATDAADKVNEMLAARDKAAVGGLSAHTLRGDAQCIRNFGSWLMDSEPGFAGNPFRKVVLRDLPKVIMPTFSPDEMAKIVRLWDSAKVGREARFFITLAYTGNRCRELAWVRRPSFLWDAKRIRVTLEDDRDRAEFARLFVTGRIVPLDSDYLDVMRKNVKGNKERYAIFMEELADLWRPSMGIGDEYLFGDWARRANASTFRKMLARVCVAAGVTLGKRHLHHFRSTNASTLLAAGLDSMLLEDHLGHDTASQTKHYSKAAGSMREACKGWGSQLRWRALSNNCPKPGTKLGQPEAGREVSTKQAACSDTEEDFNPETDFIVLPDHSEIYREALFAGTSALKLAVSEPQSQRVVSSAPAAAAVVKRNPLNFQAVDESEDIGCPS